MAAFFGIFTGTVIMISHHKYMNKRTQQQYYCVGKNAFNKLHDLKIPEWSLRNYEETRGKFIVKTVPLPILLFTSISPGGSPVKTVKNMNNIFLGYSNAIIFYF